MLEDLLDWTWTRRSPAGALISTPYRLAMERPWTLPWETTRLAFETFEPCTNGIRDATVDFTYARYGALAGLPLEPAAVRRSLLPDTTVCWPAPSPPTSVEAIFRPVTSNTASGHDSSAPEL